MKRIVLLVIVLLIIGSNVTNSYGHLSYFNPRVRWSIHKHGLIFGDFEYNPRAFSYKNPSGLAFSDVRYSPYAFGFGHSGLVYDSYAFTAPYYYQQQQQKQTSRLLNQELKRSQKIQKARRANIEARKKEIISRLENGKEIICQYLKTNKAINFRMYGLLGVGNTVVNANFLLWRNKSIMIIEYWNTESRETDYCQKHKKAWGDFHEEYQKKGINVYEIRSEDKEEILARLEYILSLF